MFQQHHKLLTFSKWHFWSFLHAFKRAMVMGSILSASIEAQSHSPHTIAWSSIMETLEWEGKVFSMGLQIAYGSPLPYTKSTGLGPRKEKGRHWFKKMDMFLAHSGTTGIHPIPPQYIPRPPPPEPLQNFSLPITHPHHKLTEADAGWTPAVVWSCRAFYNIRMLLLVIIKAQDWAQNSPMLITA